MSCGSFSSQKTAEDSYVPGFSLGNGMEDMYRFVREVCFEKPHSNGMLIANATSEWIELLRSAFEYI
jgi:hypothetical protein